MSLFCSSVSFQNDIKKHYCKMLSQCFLLKVWSFRFLTHFEWLLYTEIDAVSILLSVFLYLLLPGAFIEKLVFLQCMLLVSLLTITRLHFCGFISEILILVHWYIILFLWRQPVLLFAIALYTVLTPGFKNSPALMFSFSIAFDYL